MRRLLLALPLALALLAAACGTDQAALDRIGAMEKELASLKSTVGTVQTESAKVGAIQEQLGGVALEPGARTFVMTGFELKGSTKASELSAPTADPTKLSDGYRFKAPGYDSSDAEKWEVSSYRFEPGFMVAAQGDEITLLVFIVNGNEHTVSIEAPDGSMAANEVTMNRGREYRLTFTADQAGLYTVHCDEHSPTMVAHILVLPRV